MFPHAYVWGEKLCVEIWIYIEVLKFSCSLMVVWDHVSVGVGELHWGFSIIRTDLGIFRLIPVKESRVLQKPITPFSQQSNMHLKHLKVCDGGELFLHLAKPGFLFFVGAEVVSALEFLHSCNGVYRNLKLENLSDRWPHRSNRHCLCKEQIINRPSRPSVELLSKEHQRFWRTMTTAGWWTGGSGHVWVDVWWLPFHNQDPQQANTLLRKDPKQQLELDQTIPKVRSHMFFTSFRRSWRKCLLHHSSLRSRQRCSPDPLMKRSQHRRCLV